MNEKNIIRIKIFLNLLMFAVIIISISYITITEVQYSLLMKIVIFTIFMFFLTFFLMKNLFNLIAKCKDSQLEVIREGLNQLIHGNLSYRISNEDINGDNEVLINNFNEMVKSLELSIRIIEKSRNELEKKVVEKTANLNKTNIQLEKAMQELKITQMNKLQTEKQKSLAAIVSGFAHEINNPLAGIVGHLDLLDLKNDIPEYAKSKLQNIRKQALRIKAIVSELNLMSPNSDQTKLDINLDNFFEKFLKVMNKKHLFVNIKFLKNEEDKEIIITGNHFSLWMVFESICENAIEAIKEQKIVNGEIIIKITTSKDKKYAIIAVCDNGGGFEDINKAFDPFYTTKSRTKKKGIGLSIAYNMIREHNGSIEASNNDKGGTLTIRLPLNQSY